MLSGNGIPAFHGGAVLLGISLQVAKRIGMVASRCCWIADGGAVSLGNAIRGFHGGAVLLGNGIPALHGGPVLFGNLIANC